MAYQGVTRALQAEQTLHAAEFVFQLVDQFVHDHGRWPTSWSELEQMPFPSDTPSTLNQSLVRNVADERGYWPAASQEIQQRVMIDFQADPKTIATQNPRDFEAIKPIGPYYEFRDTGPWFPSLQKTIRKSVLHEEQSSGQ